MFQKINNGTLILTSSNYYPGRKNGLIFFIHIIYGKEGIDLPENKLKTSCHMN